MRINPLLAIVATALLLACQDKTADTADPPVPHRSGAPSATPSPPGPSPTGAPQAAKPSLEPQPMQLAEWRGADLQGELGCGFARKTGELPILFAASFVDDAAIAEAAMKFDGRVVKLATESNGGFDAMSRGTRFVGPGGIFANIVRSGERIAETPRIAEESPRYPALLVVSRGGRELAIDGFWECGP